MPLLKGGRLAPDPWRRVADGDALPPDAPSIVSLARWQAERETLVTRAAPSGIALRNHEPVATLVPDLERLALIALEFPKFTDGRAYTQARLLRERFGFRGELRATGQVLTDQLLFMRRCGFDAFELADVKSDAAWRGAFAAFSAFYQPAGDGRDPIAVLRRHRGSVGGGA